MNEELFEKLNQRYGSIVVREAKEAESTPLEHALKIRTQMRREKYNTSNRCYDIQVIREDFHKINHDLQLRKNKGIRKIFNSIKGEEMYYDDEELNSVIHDTFRNFGEYVKYQLELNESTHNDLLDETQKVQREQVEALKNIDSLETKLVETTDLLEETVEELKGFSGQRMEAESAEKRAVLKQYLDNLMRDQDNLISDILNNYDILNNIEETILTLDFYKQVNNMVNVGQRSALGEAKMITDEYKRNRDILGRIRENAEFAVQIYKTIDIVKGHLDTDFMDGRDKISELKDSYDKRIQNKRRDTARLKQERIALLRRFDDSFMNRALEYKEARPTYE